MLRFLIVEFDTFPNKLSILEFLMVCPLPLKYILDVTAGPFNKFKRKSKISVSSSKSFKSFKAKPVKSRSVLSSTYLLLNSPERTPSHKVFKSSLLLISNFSILRISDSVFKTQQAFLSSVFVTSLLAKSLSAFSKRGLMAE